MKRTGPKRMGSDFQFLEIILYAAIAVFLVMRLRGVLGKRQGHGEAPKYDPFRQNQPKKSEDDKVIPLPDRNAGDKGRRAEAVTDDIVSGPGDEPDAVDTETVDTPLSAGLTQIKLADSSFDVESFATGARAAFEMVITAFAEGNTKTLRPLLSNDVYDDFAGAIKERQEASHSLETTMIGISEAEVIEAELQSRTAFVTIKFVSEQVNVTRDSDGNIVDGDPNQITKITDIWTFARNTRSRDPNWTLVATRSSN